MTDTADAAVDPVACETLARVLARASSRLLGTSLTPRCGQVDYPGLYTAVVTEASEIYQPRPGPPHQVAHEALAELRRYLQPVLSEGPRSTDKVWLSWWAGSHDPYEVGEALVLVAAALEDRAGQVRALATLTAPSA